MSESSNPRKRGFQTWLLSFLKEGQEYTIDDIERASACIWLRSTIISEMNRLSQEGKLIKAFSGTNQVVYYLPTQATPAICGSDLPNFETLIEELGFVIETATNARAKLLWCQKSMNAMSETFKQMR